MDFKPFCEALIDIVLVLVDSSLKVVGHTCVESAIFPVSHYVNEIILHMNLMSWIPAFAGMTILFYTLVNFGLCS